MELSRRNIEFVGGYVYGAMSHIDGYEVTTEKLQLVEECVQAALGYLFPLKEEEIEDEVAALLKSLGIESPE